MFRKRIDEMVLPGAIEAHKSPSEEAIFRCEKINWFLYRSDYILGRKAWNTINPKTKKDTLEGLIRYVIHNRRIGVFVQYGTTVDYRRMRLIG